MVTFLYMWRFNLITKEVMENYCQGEIYEREDSVNDDLESLIEDLRLGKEPDEKVDTYFVPKLTVEELKMVQRKDRTYFETFLESLNPDVDEAEMKLSDSDSKFVEGWCGRKTFKIKNKTQQNIFNSCSLQ